MRSAWTCLACDARGPEEEIHNCKETVDNMVLNPVIDSRRLDAKLSKSIQDFSSKIGMTKASMCDRAVVVCMAAALRWPLKLVELVHWGATRGPRALRAWFLAVAAILMRFSSVTIEWLDGAHHTSTSICVASQEWVRIEVRYSDQWADGGMVRLQRFQGLDTQVVSVTTERGRAGLGKLLSALAVKESPRAAV